MKKFDTLEDAFQHFLDNVYPKLPSDQKLKCKDARYDFLKRGSISHNKMEKVLEVYGKATIKFEITFED